MYKIKRCLNTPLGVGFYGLPSRPMSYDEAINQIKSKVPVCYQFMFHAVPVE